MSYEKGADIILVLILVMAIINCEVVVNFNGFNIVIENAFGQSEFQMNKAPVISVISPIEGEINKTVILNASISDPDGNINTIIWNQEDEYGPVKMSIAEDKQSMSFIPLKNVTYIFSVEGIDNNGSATLKSIKVHITSP